MNEVPEWTMKLKDDLLSFLEGVRQPGPYGRFRYALRGCLLPYEPISSCYAFGILRTLNSYDALEDREKEEWAGYLRLSRLPLIEPFRKPDEGASRDMRRYHVPRQACDLG